MHKGEKVSRQIRMLSIMSVALENVMVTTDRNSILQGFSGTILPCVTSADRRVRQAAISCLGKYGLLTDRVTISTVIKPLLFEVTSNEDEVIEARAQALLGLCDLALLFDIAKNSEEFVAILSDLVQHEETTMVVLTAEVCAKLLLAGKLQHEEIMARLIIIYFTLCGSIAREEANEDVSEVGSPVRLQQILSLFFPAYCMCDKKNRITLLHAIKPIISITIGTSEVHRKKKENLASSVPTMIDFICSTVDGANLNGRITDDLCDTSGEKENDAKGDDPLAGSVNDLLLSRALFAAVSISDSLLENRSEMSATNLRTMCKTLASVIEKVELAATPENLVLMKQARKLKKNSEELDFLISDHYASAWLERLREKMELVKYDSDTSDDKTSDNGEELPG